LRGKTVVIISQILIFLQAYPK